MDFSLNDVFRLKKDWTFHYASDPYEVTWKKGAVFTLKGFQKSLCEKVLLEFEDQEGRFVCLTDDLIVSMFEKPKPLSIV